MFDKKIIHKQVPIITLNTKIVIYTTIILLITGFVFALIYKTPEYKKLIKYDWQQPDYNPSEDKFMQRFDENGIFVNPPVIEEEPEFESYYNSSHSVNYEFKEKKLD